MAMRVVALLLMLVVTACGGEATPRAKSTPTPTPTPIKVVGECTPGAAPYVVYLHGLGSSTADLSGLITHVGAKDPARGWCSYDRINAGRSARDPSDQPLAESVTELEEFLAAQGIEGPVLLVGHSYGGLLATAYAGKNPDRVHGIVLADPALPFELPLFTPKVRRAVEQITARNPENVDLLGSYREAARATLPDVPFVFVDAAQEDLPTGWGAKGYRKALTGFIASLPQGRLVESPTDHIDVLDAPELVAAVLDVS